MAISLLTQVAIVLSLLYVVRRIFSKPKNLLPLPPGPKGLPLIGAIKDLPPPGKPEYQHWLKHKDQYGPISSLTVMGMTIIILHDKTLALELMEKRGSKYSGRVRTKFANDMIGWINSMIGQQYDRTFK